GAGAPYAGDRGDISCCHSRGTVIVARAAVRGGRAQVCLATVATDPVAAAKAGPAGRHAAGTAAAVGERSAWGRAGHSACTAVGWVAFRLGLAAIAEGPVSDIAVAVAQSPIARSEETVSGLA